MKYLTDFISHSFRVKSTEKRPEMAKLQNVNFSYFLFHYNAFLWQNANLYRPIRKISYVINGKGAQER
jgi:hypothetical protein